MKHFTREDLATTEVFNNVKAYLGEHLPEYELLFVVRKSDYAEDGHLYMVAAKHRTRDEYAAWTTWNESIQSLNGGHYGLENEYACRDVMAEFYNQRKQTFAVEVKEMWSRVVIVEATSYEDAHDIVEEASIMGNIDIGFECCDEFKREVTHTAKYGEQPVPETDDTSNYWYYEEVNEN